MIDLLCEQSARAVIIHHLGTAAHGSLIIAIIKTIRAVIAYIQVKHQVQCTCSNSERVYIMSLHHVEKSKGF
jgi:hypothetical protein